LFVHLAFSVFMVVFLVNLYSAQTFFFMCVTAFASCGWLRGVDASFRLSQRYIPKDIYIHIYIYTFAESKILSGYFGNCHGPPSIYSSCCSFLFVFIYDAPLFWCSAVEGQTKEMLWTNREHVQVNAAFEEMFSCLRLSEYPSICRLNDRPTSKPTCSYKCIYVSPFVDLVLALLGAGFQNCICCHWIGNQVLRKCLQCVTWLDKDPRHDSGSRQRHWAPLTLVPSSKNGQLAG